MHYSFYLFLFFAILFVSVAIVRGLRGQTINTVSFVCSAAAITGCIWSALEL